jgi:hypothetical protein
MSRSNGASGKQFLVESAEAAEQFLIDKGSRAEANEIDFSALDCDQSVDHLVTNFEQ